MIDTMLYLIFGDFFPKRISLLNLYPSFRFVLKTFISLKIEGKLLKSLFYWNDVFRLVKFCNTRRTMLYLTFGAFFPKIVSWLNLCLSLNFVLLSKFVSLWRTIKHHFVCEFVLFFLKLANSRLNFWVFLGNMEKFRGLFVSEWDAPGLR